LLTPASGREHLREYLHGLGSDRQAELLANVERAVLGGEHVPDADLILAELRQVIRHSAIKSERVGSPSRRFFDPVAPFIVDEVASTVVRGRIARTSLNPIWIWISRDLLPKEAKPYSDAVNRALGASDDTAAAAHAEAFHALALPRIRNALASQEARRRLGDRLTTYMGQPRAVADLREIATVLAIRRPLAAVAGKLPEHIESLSGRDLANIMQALDDAATDFGEEFIYALRLVMGRLAERWQLIRLAVPAATGRADAATTPRRLAITLVMADTEEMLAALRAALRSGETGEIGELVRAIGSALVGLESELDLSGNDFSRNSWAAQKVKMIRNEVHALLAAELEGVPTSISRLFELNVPTERASGGRDAAVAATEREVTLLQLVRPFAGPLALGGKIASALSHIRIGLERAIAALLEHLRSAFDAARNFCLVQISHAVRICARLFGKPYASAIVAATEAAINDEQRAA